MFDTVLVANRGEIAVRVIRTLRAMGIRSVAVYSDADADAPHVQVADVAVRIGPALATESYLSIERIVDAATQTGANAIHPGYGFLSENAKFAAACAKAGIVFIGPPASAIEAMGDKIRAKLTVSAAGVPVVPGRTESGMSDDALTEAAIEVGFPVLLKPSAGGGGKGMRLVTAKSELADAIASARREARSSFGDDTLLVERFVTRPRHIEIQVLADTHSTAVHLGERECSLQRRHQKIVEEAPSPLLDAETRERMGKAAVEAAKSVGYTGAGTVEFIASSDRPDEFFFMEMNTRLQVEHPVTELVTGLDLVEQQILIAAGDPLSFAQEQVRLTGHAIEARIYAEDPARGFLPTGGTVLALREPEPPVRVDSALAPGVKVTSDYDPMLAKYIAHGRDRDEALRKLRTALAETAILGVTTNISFLRRLLSDDDVKAGHLDTDLVGRKLETLVTHDIPAEVLAAAALERALALEPSDDNPWNIPGGWRIGAHSWTKWLIGPIGSEPTEVATRGRANDAEITIANGTPVRANAHWSGSQLVCTYDSRVRRYRCARDNGTLWLTADGDTWSLTETERLAAAVSGGPGAHVGPITSPMPGTVLAVKVAAGQQVDAGAPLLIVEAMKMEHTITAPVAGVVTELNVQEGQPVALGEALALITPEELRETEESR